MADSAIDINKPALQAKSRRSVVRKLAWIAPILGLALAACGGTKDAEKPQTGDLRLSYAFPEAGGEEIPYRVYLPSDWTSRKSWPMVVVLHGYASTADAPFDNAKGDLQKEAEKHGFVVVAPNGYNGMADYGANLPLPSELGRFDKPLEMKQEEEGALAEADVLNVVDLATKDYYIDPRRIYLMGNSMGMTGVLHLASTRPDSWCAISASGGPPWPDFPVERLKPLAGALFVHGEADDLARASDTEELTSRAKAAGIDARMHVVPGGTHATGWVGYLPQTFDFFDEKDCARR